MKAKTTAVTETVFVLECFFPPYKDSSRRHTPGRWVTCYSHVYAMGTEDIGGGRITSSAHKHLEKLKAKAQGWTGIPGRLNLHHDGLAYIERKDAEAALKYIRKHGTCKYKVRIIRETVWKEHVVCRPADKLVAPFKTLMRARFA